LPQTRYAGTLYEQHKINPEYISDRHLCTVQGNKMVSKSNSGKEIGGEWDVVKRKYGKFLGVGTSIRCIQIQYPGFHASLLNESLCKDGMFC
jgi:hypothetical protein